MPVRLSRFEMPNRLQKDEESATDAYAQFVAEPFEGGYGHTLGNSLRRVLLSSLEGAAITSVKIKGAPHEFCTLPGVVEDVTDIVLNLKKVRFRHFENKDPRKLSLVVDREGIVTAGDIQEDASYQVINPAQHICTLDRKVKFEMDLEIRVGRGFATGEENKRSDAPIGVIPIDSIFSPVNRVKYAVENTRVGQKTDFDKLILDVWTDGRITPHDALTQASAILRHHLDVFVNYDDSQIEFDQAVGSPDREFDLIDAHIEQFFEFSILFVLRFWGLIEFDLAVVVVDEDIQMMAQNGAGLGQGVMRRDATVGPHIQDQLIEVRLLADPRVFHRVFDPVHRRENRINRNHPDRRIRPLVFFTCGKSAADPDFQVHLKFHFAIERADVLGRVDDLVAGVLLDIAGRHNAFAINNQTQFPRVFVLEVAEPNFFQVQHDVGHVFDHAGQRTKFMRGPFDFHGGDGCAFERAEQHPAQAVAEGMAVATFKRFSNKLGISIGGRLFIFLKAVRHLET